MKNMESIEKEKISLVEYIIELFEKSLKEKEKRLKPEQKAPKESQHVMCSKAALERFLKEGPKEIAHVFRNVEYKYKMANALYGFRCYKIWLIRCE